MRLGYWEKYITVAKLRGLLAELPDDAWLSTRTLADTGNIVISVGDPAKDDLKSYGIIDVAAEDIERFE